MTTEESRESLDRAVEEAREKLVNEIINYATARIGVGASFVHDAIDDLEAAVSERARAEERERVDVLVWREHVPVTGTQHDPANGLIHGYCQRCRTEWPCEWSPERARSSEEAGNGS